MARVTSVIHVGSSYIVFLSLRGKVEIVLWLSCLNILVVVSFEKSLVMTWQLINVFFRKKHGNAKAVISLPPLCFCILLVSVVYS